LTIQGQAIGVPSGAAQATHLPGEIAFLVRHGVPMQVLRQAARIAVATGVTAEQAAIKSDLLDEVTYYRALARELNLPFLPEATLDERCAIPRPSWPESLRLPRP
jgi:hypothetical protein